MAFFTRMNSNVPVLPPEDFGPDGNIYPTMAQVHMHRRYASEPVTTTAHNNHAGNSRPNSVPSGSSTSSSVSKSPSGVGAVDRNASNTVVSTSIDEDVSIVNNATNSKSVSAKNWPATNVTESNAPSSENGENEAAKSIEKNNGNGEPKRYEYVVDRVLGVEV